MPTLNTSSKTFLKNPTSETRVARLRLNLRPPPAPAPGPGPLLPTFMEPRVTFPTRSSIFLVLYFLSDNIQLKSRSFMVRRRKETPKKKSKDSLRRSVAVASIIPCYEYIQQEDQFYFIFIFHSPFRVRSRYSFSLFFFVVHFRCSFSSFLFHSRDGVGFVRDLTAGGRRRWILVRNQLRVVQACPDRRESVGVMVGGRRGG